MRTAYVPSEDQVRIDRIEEGNVWECDWTDCTRYFAATSRTPGLISDNLERHTLSWVQTEHGFHLCDVHARIVRAIKRCARCGRQHRATEPLRDSLCVFCDRHG